MTWHVIKFLFSLFFSFTIFIALYNYLSNVSMSIPVLFCTSVLNLLNKPNVLNLHYDCPSVLKERISTSIHPPVFCKKYSVFFINRMEQL